MTRTNSLQASSKLRQLSIPLGAWLLAANGCSFKSLDHLQGGERDAAEAGGGAAVAGQHSGGKGATALAGGTTSAGSGGIREDSAGSSSMAGASLQGGAGTGTTAPEGGSSTTGLGGTTASSGATSTLGGSALAGSATGGAATTTTMGGGSSGGPAVTGGITSVAGSSGNSSGAGKAGTTGTAGRAGNTGVSTGGLPGTGGAAATGGAPGTGGAPATGGVPGMIYNVVGQSCGTGLACPTSSGCCTQLEVPAGSYPMGTNTDASRNADESPPHTATLDRFVMDKFEVTVGRFRSFVAAYDGTMPGIGMGAHPKITGSGWLVGYDANMPASKAALQSMINCNTGQYQTWTETAGVRETMPMNCVSWYVAFAFCIWDGGRLPTEAEWEMAACNAANDTRFPWGSTDPVPATHAVMNCLGDGTSNCSPSDILAVGSRPSGANQWGHLDLAGSLWEWTLDYYNATYYQSIGTCSNCASLSDTTPRVIRGGNFTSTLVALRATGRASKAPITADPYSGFRCVRTP